MGPRTVAWIKNPRRLALTSLAITAGCLPLYIVRWRLGPLPTTLLENLILLTGVIWLFSLWSERRLPRLRTPFTIPIALLLVGFQLTERLLF